MGPRLALAVLGLALLAALPIPAAAQQDLSGPQSIVKVAVTVEPGALDVPRLGQATYRILIEDISGPYVSPVDLHTVRLVQVVNESSLGWVSFLGQTFFQMRAGEVRESFLTVQAPPTVRSQFFHARVFATVNSSIGVETTDSQDVVARIAPYALFNVDISITPPQLGPFESTRIPVRVSNFALYPDTFLLSAEAPPGWLTSLQPELTLFPGEERVVWLTVLTPAAQVFTPLETGIITVRAQSTLDPGFTFDRATVVMLEGMHLPGYWAPVLLLGAVVGAATVRRSLEDGRRRAKELGKPLPQRPTPAQQVLLAHLKKTDPERYRALQAAQRRVFRARVATFLRVRGRRMELERALVQRQHEQARQEKAAAKERERALALKARELERRREALAREQQRRDREAAAARAREERQRLAEEQRRQRAEAPARRKAERERLARERKLRAEVERRKRQLAAEERKRRVELERKARLLARRKLELERKAQRAARKGSLARRGKRGDGDQGGQGGQPGQGEGGAP